MVVSLPQANQLVTFSFPSELVLGYQKYLGTQGLEVPIEQAMSLLCEIPAKGYFGGSAMQLQQMRSLLDALAIETGLCMTDEPTATQRLQALAVNAKALRKTAMPDTLGQLAGSSQVDRLLSDLEENTVCAGFDASSFITLNTTTDWQYTQRWFATWLQQALASVLRS